jgi:hypothetical protein
MPAQPALDLDASFHDLVLSSPFPEAKGSKACPELVEGPSRRRNRGRELDLPRGTRVGRFAAIAVLDLGIYKKFSYPENGTRRRSMASGLAVRRAERPANSIL